MVARMVVDYNVVGLTYRRVRSREFEESHTLSAMPASHSVGRKDEKQLDTSVGSRDCVVVPFDRFSYYLTKSRKFTTWYLLDLAGAGFTLEIAATTARRRGRLPAWSVVVWTGLGRK